ncbi:hypothetical protein GobsT_58720 [Gemmata obscuriglobus]|uniref:Uma2 family endonuclease n=1 Tax=Gemmata obscuriglobus TaxID=114 RepID=A0A2Z3GXW4_9BACT|nr:Uma2 family endonuclease [Gemmata obscuriglobus]AWM36337.1 Uma2 family endonuclease [Gemmata obscuriglobus]QEG31051.1 hypothetical protein GobsT_58720 [Gemmata obscuriglobus]VTS10388.1 Hypothetical conserved protein OS=uncultured planctomycete GN=HGMM_F09D09C05 PE=4 SV=1: Uma2 [Gemmata obscuriglobus UQM 2246]
MTVEEFWEFVHRPEHEPRSFHLIRGTVVEEARPERLHGVVAVRLGSFLEEYARRIRFGYVVLASGVILAQNPVTVIGPDVAYFTDVNRFEDLPPKWGDVPPVLAVEVSSPSDNTGTTNEKVRACLANGVKVVWQVDYEERNVTVYRPNKVMEVVRESGELTGGDDLPGLVIQVADIFKLPGGRNPPPPTSPPAGS